MKLIFISNVYYTYSIKYAAIDADIHWGLGSPKPWGYKVIELRANEEIEHRFVYIFD